MPMPYGYLFPTSSDSGWINENKTKQIIKKEKEEKQIHTVLVVQKRETESVDENNGRMKKREMVIKKHTHWNGKWEMK